MYIDLRSLFIQSCASIMCSSYVLTSVLQAYTNSSKIIDEPSYSYDFFFSLIIFFFFFFFCVCNCRKYVDDDVVEKRGGKKSTSNACNKMYAFRWMYSIKGKRIFRILRYIYIYVYISIFNDRSISIYIFFERKKKEEKKKRLILFVFNPQYWQIIFVTIWRCSIATTINK